MNLDLIVTGCSNGGGVGPGVSCNSREAFVYINNGTSLEENQSWQWNLTGVWQSAIACGDVDNDGDLDLLSTGRATTSAENSKIYINNGTSLEESEQWQTNLDDIYTSGVAFGDIDNDGDIDLALTGYDNSDGISKIYLNNGTSFEESTTWEENIAGKDESSLSFGDYDNDGDLDLVLLGATDSLIVYENNGSQFIINETSPGSLTGVYDGSLAFGDYNNDGDLDLIAGGRELYIHVYQSNIIGSNSGIETFAIDRTSDANLTAVWDSPVFIWGDIDMDKDLDLFLVGDADAIWIAKVYISNQSETYANTPPVAPTSDFANYTTADGIFFGWGTGNDTETNHTGLYYNLRIGSTSGGNEIVTGVYGGGEDNGYFGNMMQRRNITLKPDRFSNFTNYYWSVQTIDTALNASNWSEEQMYTTGTDITYPEVKLDYPPNNFGQANNSVTFNYTVVEENMGTCELMGNWSGGWHVNQSITNPANNTETNFTTIELNEGVYIWNVMCNDSVDNRKLADENFSLWIDLTDPVIKLRTPENSITYTQGNVTFTYNVTDRDINNCSLIINDAVNSTDSSVSTGENQSFTIDLYNDNYNWSINCTDRANNVNNSQTRNLKVSCTESWTCTGWNACQGGTQTRTCVDANNCPAENNKPSESQACGTTNAGPGGGSTSRATASPTITTDKTNLIIKATQGEIATETIKITNNNTRNVNYEITTNLPAVIEPNTFTLKPGEEQTVKINLIATAEPGTHTGTITIKTDNIQKTIITALTIKRKEALFDVKIRIPDKFETVFAGEEVTAEIEIINLGKIGQVDTKVEYSIKDSEGKIITSGHDTLAVEEIASFIRTLKIPEEIKQGTYTYFVNITYKDTSTTGETTFTIKKRISYMPAFIQKRYLEILIWVIGTAALLTAFFVAREKYFKKMIKDVKRKERRLEKRISKIEKKKKRRKQGD